MEKDFLYKIEMKNQIIQEKTTRIQELQDELFNYESNMNQMLAIEKNNFDKQVHEVHDKLSSIKQKYNDLKIEHRDTLDDLKRIQDLNNDHN